ncbi:hypothetical protein HY995_05510 [Candidatus Micrarchaeota archaeon]|nr:hypothetical protein [Candidatus Micrarchaeota archaeon]MBI5177512.1 hypothetical protein [Candidatus Micrarchaeota archaeon]
MPIKGRARPPSAPRPNGNPDPFLIPKPGLGALLILALAACVALFYFTRNPVFAVAGFAALAGLVLRDIIPSTPDAKGVKSTIVELAYALGLAVAVWLVLQFLLGTDTPVDVVTSCSMLPNLERGDMIVVQGLGDARSNSLQFSGGVDTLFSGPDRLRRLARQCTVNTGGAVVSTLCTSGVEYAGGEYSQDRQGDILVFIPTPRDVGLIVHRSFLRLANGTDEFFLTKGDNNVGLDQEAGFLPVPSRDVKGKVLFRIPLLGYLKLFLFMQFEEPQGCRFRIVSG